MSFGIDHNRLLAALTSLPRSRAAALRALPGLLNDQGEGHTTVSALIHGGLKVIASNTTDIPAGTDLPDDGVVGHTLRTGSVNYVTDTSKDARYRSFGSRYDVELALPLSERDETVAVLNIERKEPFTREELHTLIVFSVSVGEILTESSRGQEAVVSAALSAELAAQNDFREAAELALRIVAGAVNASAAVIVTDRRGRMIPVAGYNVEEHARAAEVLRHGAPYPDGILWRALMEGKAQLTFDYATERGTDDIQLPMRGPVVAVPIGREADHAVMALLFEAGTHVSAADLELLANVSRHLGIILNAVQAYALQERLFDLHTRTSDGPTTDLYQQILDTAIEFVPGAQAGSLLVRRNHREPFRYTAVSGFDAAILDTVQLEESNMLVWYAQGSEAWYAGQPRVLSAADLDLVQLSLDSAQRDEPVRAGDMKRLRSTACLPITHGGEVLAVLNLDNFTRDEAFSRGSVRTLTQFAQPVARLIAAAHHRDELERASTTDQLTGLPNRRGFRQSLDKADARARRKHEPYTLLSMDLTGFKSINDHLGHDAGDTALNLVARAFVESARGDDVFARWGGDEFTALLPDTSEEAATVVAERVEAAVEAIDFEGHRLGIDIGHATYPADGRTTAALLEVADRRMYERKNRRKQTA